MNKKNKQYQYGYDYDKTADHLPMLPFSVVITGRKKKDEKELRDMVGDVPIYFLPDEMEHNGENVGLHKSKIIKELGLKRFFEDTPENIELIRRMNPEVTVVEVKPDALKYVVFTSEGTGIPIAHHLALEGYEVYVGQAETFRELGIESTPEEDKKLRDSQSLYKGILKKYPAQKLLKVLEKVKDKDNYFIYCDLNSLYKYGERLLKAGFTKGIFPTKKDYDFEKGREQAMEFVEKNYEGIKIIPHVKVKTVDEAKKIVEESEVPLVIQSEGDFVSTICPVDDVEKNKAEILSALEKFASDYSKGEIILKEKLIQPIEITPQIVFWNGEPVFTDIDIETKNIGDGENNGNQVGCGSNIIIKTKLDDEINKIAFPPIVYEMAKEHKGIFVWDISIYFTDDGMYFGEFCSNRFGYDAVLTEMSMAGGSGRYFDALQSLQNPLQHEFGAAVRVFNLNKQKGTELTVGNEDYTWVYEMKEEDDKLVSLGIFWDLAVITGCGDTFEDAVNEAYENLPSLTFKEKYSRTKSDFMEDYPTSIVRRFNETNHKYYDAPDLIGDVVDSSKQLKNMSSNIDATANELKEKLEQLIGSKKQVDKMKVGIKDRVKSLLYGNK